MFVFCCKVNRANAVIARNNFPCTLLYIRPIEAYSKAEDVSFLLSGHGCFPWQLNKSGIGLISLAKPFKKE
jgi:hypothetical protein